MRPVEVKEDVCECLKTITHPVRLAIIITLRSKEMNVGELMEELGNISQSNLSQHLGALYSRNILKRRREKTQVFYSVVDRRIFKLLKLIQEVFCKQRSDS